MLYVIGRSDYYEGPTTPIAVRHTQSAAWELARHLAQAVTEEKESDPTARWLDENPFSSVSANGDNGFLAEFTITKVADHD